MDSCSGPTRSGSDRPSHKAEEKQEEERALKERLSHIRHKIVVLSGKGGVGKSTIAVNLAVALATSGKRVGLLDSDIHGPSVPTMLGLERRDVKIQEGEIIPVELNGLKVLSIGFFLRNADDAVIWRGPLKMGAIKQFLKDVAWGDLDFLIIDSPPGTGDEPLSVCQLIGKLDGAVIVTTPQKVAAIDVRKAITFCRQVEVPVLGVVENMSGFACPHCGEVTSILGSGGGEHIAKGSGVPFLGSIPMDPMIARACDSGQAFIDADEDSPSVRTMREIVKPIRELDESEDEVVAKETTDKRLKRFAIPLDGAKVSMHLGHCERFALIDVDPSSGNVLGREDVEAPPHQPGLLPSWLGERGADVVIAPGMGQRAQDLLAEQNIEVVVGASADTPEELVRNYLSGALQVGENICDH